jgi:hypothetical protein
MSLKVSVFLMIDTTWHRLASHDSVHTLSTAREGRRIQLAAPLSRNLESISFTHILRLRAFQTLHWEDSSADPSRS